MQGKMVHIIIGIVLFGILAVGDWYLVTRGALRDSRPGGEEAPFSFSRTQLLWWTNIILGGLFLSYLRAGILPDLNQTCLVLLGIGLGTAASARIVDSRSDKNPKAKATGGPAVTTFFGGILSDNRGVSIHRFQALVFNVVYGVTFVLAVIHATNGVPHATKVFPTYSEATLGLLLVSSAGYVAVKTTEKPAS